LVIVPTSVDDHGEDRNPTLPTAEIITIGTELLLGEIVNTNTQVIALALRKNGVDVYRTASVGDNLERIADILNESLARADIVILTGGLGPTVDDPTREAIAQALDLELEYQPQLWDHIVERFSKYGIHPPENNKQQAYLPKGAQSLPNPRGTAPGIFLETKKGHIIALPGVPSEMEGMLNEQVIPRIIEIYELKDVILTRNIRVEGIGESRVDQMLRDLGEGSNPTVGLAAGKGFVLIRLTAKAESEDLADVMLGVLEEEINQRLADWNPSIHDK
jgi:competence/damage-inducible protein CinA-like protein